MRLAILDLGTNSVRYDIHEIGPERSAKKQPTLKRLYRDKIMVRLGEGVFNQGKLSPIGKERTLLALERFAQIGRSYGVHETIAFGTSALRDAKDRRSFLAEAKARSGINLRVISGKEEAHLIALGVLHHEDLPSGRFALIDIGGGSTEVSLCEGNRVIASHSFQLGVARLHQLFLNKSPPSSKQIEACRSWIRKQWEKSPLVKQSRHPYRQVIGSSGTIRALTRLVHEKKASQATSLADLRDLVGRLSHLTQEEILKLPEMEPKRVELILAGGILIEELMVALSAKNLKPSEYSLRDGILSEKLTDLRPPSPDDWKKDLTSRSSEALTELVTSTCELLFHRLKKMHRLSPNWVKTLSVATQLNEMGDALGMPLGEEHAAHLALTTPLTGIRSEERETIADLCRAHRLTSTTLGKGSSLKTKRALGMMRLIDSFVEFQGAHAFHSLKKNKKGFVLHLKKMPVSDLIASRIDRNGRALTALFGVHVSAVVGKKL